MSRSDTIKGFVWGSVTKRDDPEVNSQVKVKIPGLYDVETPFWVMPMGWGGAGGERQGSQYPAPPLDAQVGVIFERGLWQGPGVRAVYFTGYYGLGSDMQSVGPSQIRAASTAERARQRTCLWENEKFSILIIDEEDDKRILLTTKTRGSLIEIDAKAGADGNSEAINIEAATSVNIYSKGLLDIRSDTQVKIQGRKVSGTTKSPI